jgi:hypothetical protein
MTISAALPERTDVRDADRYQALLARLSALSVTHHFDAYGDIDWDSPGFEIDRTDPRWELPADDPLTITQWYRTLTTEQRLSLGLDRVVTMMKTGIEFERILKQGLLEFAGTLPNGAPEFRYAYHEVIEECQHSGEYANCARTLVCSAPAIDCCGAYSESTTPTCGHSRGAGRKRRRS